MRAHFHIAALGLAALLLSACNKSPSDMPLPIATLAPGEAASASAESANTSVPDAATVFAPAAGAQPASAAGRANEAMSKAQESSAMPMQGQANDHSAPLTPARGASSP
jgi:hypothetical protein